MKLMLFLGAGVSIPSGLPSAVTLTNSLFSVTGDDCGGSSQISAILRIIADYDAADMKRCGSFPTEDGYRASGAIYRSGASTYEDLYYLCEEIHLWHIGLADNCLTTAFMERIVERAGDILSGSSLEARLWSLGHLGRPACEFIGNVVAKTLKRPYLTGFDLIRELADSAVIDELNIATLNHDTLVEAFLRDHGHEVVDGFGKRDGDIRWCEDQAFSQPARIRILKLHGSIDWFAFQRDGRAQTAIFVGDDLASAADGAGRALTPEFRAASFLSGLNKPVSYDRGIYADVHFRFGEILRRCDRMIMSGYGWGDIAINHQLEAWFDRSRDNRLLLLHEDFKSLVDHSMTLSACQGGWVRNGQLIPAERWLCNTRLSDADEFLAQPAA